MLLNFGHTFGHAIEKLCNFKDLSHGIAVALGMELISVAPLYHGEMKACDFTRMHNLIMKYGYFDYPTPEFEMDLLVSASLNDKKRRGNNISIVICPEIGTAQIKTMTVSEYTEYER
jgi:3-dehydroquinate synthase